MQTVPANLTITSLSCILFVVTEVFKLKTVACCLCKHKVEHACSQVFSMRNTWNRESRIEQPQFSRRALVYQRIWKLDCRKARIVIFQTSANHFICSFCSKYSYIRASALKYAPSTFQKLHSIELRTKQTKIYIFLKSVSSICIPKPFSSLSFQLCTKKQKKKQSQKMRRSVQHLKKYCMATNFDLILRSNRANRDVWVYNKLSSTK